VPQQGNQEIRVKEFPYFCRDNPKVGRDCSSDSAEIKECEERITHRCRGTGQRRKCPERDTSVGRHKFWRP
jgi:hypothetical protein